MEENKDITAKNTEKTGGFIKSFLLDVLAGFGMGVAFIIPGFSGGSVAVILGVYEKLISAIADIFKDFKKSVVTLLPIFIGLVIGAVSLLYPLGWALSAFPLPTVSLFVGLAVGGMFSVTDNAKGSFKWYNVLSFAIPFLAVLLLSFAPTGADVDLFNLDFGGYILLFVIGIIASAALVIPGIFSVDATYWWIGAVGGVVAIGLSCIKKMPLAVTVITSVASVALMYRLI